MTGAACGACHTYLFEARVLTYTDLDALYHSIYLYVFALSRLLVFVCRLGTYVIFYSFIKGTIQETRKTYTRGIVKIKQTTDDIYLSLMNNAHTAVFPYLTRYGRN